MRGGSAVDDFFGKEKKKTYIKFPLFQKSGSIRPNVSVQQ